MQPKARALTLTSLPKGRQPDRRDQITPGELGQHPRVDAVGLARQRRQPLDPLRVGDLHLPPQALQRVVHEPRAVHRLDHRTDGPRPVAQLDQPDQPGQRIGVRRRRADLDALTVLIEQAVIHPPTTEIQTSVQHMRGASFGSLVDDTPELATTTEALLHDIRCPGRDPPQDATRTTMTDARATAAPAGPG